VAGNTGRFVVLSGAWNGDELALTGTDETPAGTTTEVRSTIRPESTGVVETWETRRPAGAWHTMSVRRYAP
jgi:hypothetical protein